ncbi:MAG: hypothetical protein QXU87_05225 [Candidatus Caldarchaeum sp.]
MFRFSQSLSIIVFEDGLEKAMKHHTRKGSNLVKGLRSGRLRLATTTISLAAANAHLLLAAMAQQTGQGGGPAAIANTFQGAVSGFGQLLLLIAAALLGSGLALKFLPTGSHRTKDAGGQLLDSALILAGLAALGVYLLYFAATVATTGAGFGTTPPQPSSPWEVPRF